jgi:hypothetical protein
LDDDGFVVGARDAREIAGIEVIGDAQFLHGGKGCVAGGDCVSFGDGVVVQGLGAVMMDDGAKSKTGRPGACEVCHFNTGVGLDSILAPLEKSILAGQHDGFLTDEEEFNDVFKICMVYREQFGRIESASTAIRSHHSKIGTSFRSQKFEGTIEIRSASWNDRSDPSRMAE